MTWDAMLASEEHHMIVVCVTCGQGMQSDNPGAWIEHLNDGGHIFHTYTPAESGGQ